MSISAHVICDSLSPTGKRITTLAIELPKPYLAEFNTHRTFSRSFMSSRAIPVSTMLKRVQEEPYIPLHWGKNQKGMSAEEECDNLLKVWEPYPQYHSSNEASWEVEEVNYNREDFWVRGRDSAVEYAKSFHEAGYHKQIVNRLLEPFSYTVGVVTATEWDNFFQLRLHPAAQPELQALAKAMKEAMEASTPIPLEVGKGLNSWHLPFLQMGDYQIAQKYILTLPVEGNMSIGIMNLSKQVLEVLKKLSVARCARVSYGLNSRTVSHTVEDDLALYERLLKERHYSPFEHQATPMDGWFGNREIWPEGVTHMNRWGDYWSHNFRGWVQYRALIQNPNLLWDTQ